MITLDTFKMLDTFKFSHSHEKQTRYLSQAIQLEEAVNPHIIRATMGMVSLAIFVFVIWAAFTNIHEVARTPGEVVPAGHQQSVQHLEGGMVKEIMVREGDVVTKGQVMLVLNESGLLEDLERARSKQISLEMQTERLRAFIEGRDPDFSRFSESSAITLSDQKDFFEGMKNAREGEMQIVQNQVEEKQKNIKTLVGDLETAQNNLAIAQEMYGKRQKLNAKGYASDMQLLNDRQQINEIKGDIARLKSQKEIAETGLKEYQVRLGSLSAKQVDDVNERLDLTLAESEQNIKVIEKLEDRLKRLDIRAPTSGLVQGFNLNTIGEVVQPGQTIMEIVPLDKQLEVQVKISPQDIGHVAVGQDVQLKFSTYDFSRYGSVPGKLEGISATTFNGDRGERFYRGTIRLSQGHVGVDARNVILPGMTVMADVITGEKTILQYLLKPIHLSLKTAFTER